MKRPPQLALALIAASLIAACATERHAKPQAAGADTPNAAARRHAEATGRPQLGYALPAGRHDCELGQRVSLRRDSGNAERVDLEWQGRSYAMTRHRSSSGLPRYEHAGGRLVWIELPWKGMLLDRNTGRPLANECKPA